MTTAQMLRLELKKPIEKRQAIPNLFYNFKIKLNKATMKQLQKEAEKIDKKLKGIGYACISYNIKTGEKYLIVNSTNEVLNAFNDNITKVYRRKLKIEYRAIRSFSSTTKKELLQKYK